MLSSNSNNNFLHKSIFEALEDRVLFDGVPDATFVLPEASMPDAIPAQVQHLQSADSQSPHELVVIDAGVEDVDQLLEGILASKPNSVLEIRVLDASSDGVQQITDILAASAGKYDALHILSHGDEGEVTLGNAKLTAENATDYVDELSAWAGALTADADLLFYGCELAGDASGESLISYVSAVTGADVAASDDLTGAADQGGDWDLEEHVGAIETASLAAENWNHVLTSGVTVQPGNGDEIQTTTATTDVFFSGNNTNGAGNTESGWDATVTGAGGTVTSTTDFSNPTLASTAFNGGTFTVTDDTGSNDLDIELTTSSGLKSGTSGNAARINPAIPDDHGGTIVTTITFNLTSPVNSFAVDIVDTFDTGQRQGDVTVELFVDGVLQGYVSAPDNGPGSTTATYFDANGVALGTGTVGNGLENFFGVISSTSFSTVEIVHTADGTGDVRDVFSVDNVRWADVTTPAPSADTDGDNVPDDMDADKDGDGISDLEEGYGILPDGTPIADALGGTGVITDGAAWSNVLAQLTPNGQATVEDFESFGTDTPLDGLVGNGFTISVVENLANGDGSGESDVDAAQYGTSPLSGNRQGTVAQRFDNPGEVILTFTFDQPVIGFGINIGDVHDGSDTSTFEVAFDGTTVWSSEAFVGSNGQGTVTNSVSGETQLVGNQIFGFLGNYDPNAPVSVVTVTYDSPLGDNWTFDDVSFISAGRDTDGDGVFDHCDLDSDNDGISDLVESGNQLAINADTDGDGVISTTEATAAGFTDGDGDGAWDQLTDAPVDTDMDGIADYLDLDSDNDGIPDVVESQPTDTYVAPTGMDSDMDGIDDAFDTDEGGQFTVPVDTDNDGTADVLDTDSDNDGLDDIDEHGLPLTGSDLDGDGIDDGVNASYADTDGDVNVPATALDDVDSDPSDVDYRSFDDLDGDSIPDAVDADKDGDGISDIDEGGYVFTPPPAGTVGVADAFSGSGFYQVISDQDVDDDGSTDLGQLYILDAATGNYQLIGGPQEINYNGMGLNSDDGFLYAVASSAGTDAAGNAIADGDLIRIDRDGEVFQHATPNQVINDSVLSGSMATIPSAVTDGTNTIAAGTTVLAGFDTGGRVFLIDIATGNTVYHTTVNPSPPDLDSVVFDGVIYGAPRGQSAIAVTDLTDGIASIVPVSGLPAGPYGAAWGATNAQTGAYELYVSHNNNGRVYRIDNFDTATPTAEVAVQATRTGLNDGGSDLTQPFPFSVDTDGDGIPNHCDLDSDNDGISDLVESGNQAAIDADADGDGVISLTEATTAGFTDGDGDGAWDQLTDAPVDTDMDGIADYLDLDSDNDGIPDVVESQPTDTYVAPTGMDSDMDGIDDAFDTDESGQFSVPVDTDNDGTADVLDTDSDNDGIDDIDEHGLPLTGSDLDGDGIDDGVNASYADTDGDVNVPSADLEDVDSDPSDVDYRSFDDKDLDGVADAADADADGDGIFDSFEQAFAAGDNGSYTWTHNLAGGTSTAGGHNQFGPGAEHAVASSADAILGDGFTELQTNGNPASGGNGMTFEFYIDGVTSATLNDARTNDHYVEMAFTTLADFAGSVNTLTQFNHGTQNTGGGSNNFTDFDMAIEVSTDGFATPGDLLFQDFNIDRDNSGYNFRGGPTLNYELAEGTTYTFRAYLYNDTGVGVNGSNGQVDQIGRVTFDDSQFVISEVTVSEVDTDNDGIPDHCDVDSDNDGISDLIESGNQAAIDADTDGDGIISGAEAAAAGFTDADGDGAWDELGSTPVDTDMDGIADYLDLDSDNDGIPDAIEAQPSDTYTAPDGSTLYTPEDTDGDGTPDYLDTDSDNDGVDDTTESGLSLTGNDNDDDGIDDGVNASYSDPDGDVNDPFSDLENGTDNVTTEVDYRSVNDKDWDMIPDHEDADADGDGILDVFEFVEGANLLVNPTFSDYDPASAAQTFRGGNSSPPFSYSFDESNIAGWETTAPDSRIEIWDSGFNGIDSQDGISHAEIAANDGTSTLFQDFATVGGETLTWSIWHRGRGSDTITDEANVLLGDATAPIGSLTVVETMSTDNTAWVNYSGTYVVPVGQTLTRIGFKSVSTASANLASGNFIDNLEIRSLVPFDTDGDGISDHCDPDSDNDGISDLVESGNQTLIDADADGDGVVTAAEAGLVGLVDADMDGVWDGTEMTPVDTDNDGIADYLDLDSDNDKIPDAVEAQLTSNYQTPAIGTDTDGDGVVDTFDDPSVVHGGDFAEPVDTDNDGTPDYLDDDSDNDGISDTEESGLNAVMTGTDNNGDGIDDGVAPNSYNDTDGIITNTGTDLDNDDGGTAEVDYREINPAIGVAKEIVGTPVQQADGTFAVTYSIVVENTGAVDLADVSVLEDLSTEFGAAFVSAGNLRFDSAPGDVDSAIFLETAFNGNGNNELIDNSGAGTVLQSGDSFSVLFDVVINPTTSALDNQVTASGTAVDEMGNELTDPISGLPLVATDDSDSGADPDGVNAGEDGDTGGSDDATPLYLPGIGLAKSAGDAVANGDNFDVTFTLNWENTGNVALDGVEIFDDIMAQFGGQFVDASIDSVSTSGSATVAANAAWEGTAGDTALSLITHTGADLAVGDTIEVVFTVTIDPDASGTSTSGLENTATSTGTGVNPSTGLPDTDLAAADTSDNGVDPTGENGADENSDGTFGNDPTPIVIPDISVAKQVVSTTPNGDNFDVVYQLVVENTGNVDLANVSLVDDLDTQFGSAFVGAGSLSLASAPSASSTIVIDAANWDGENITEMINQSAANLLAVGDQFTVQFTVEVDPDATGTSGPLNNQATTGGDAVDDNGDPILGADGMTPLGATDDSDNGTDPNGDNGAGGSDDPTPLLLPDLRVAKQANTVTEVAGLSGVFEVEYLVVIENTGTIELTDLQITDDISLASNFGDAYTPVTASGTDRTGLVSAPMIVSHTVANAPADLPNLNAGFLGGPGAAGEIFDGASGTLQTGEQIMVAYTVRIDASELTDGDAGDAPNPGNQVQGSANHPTGTVTDDSDDGLNPNTDNGAGTTDDPTPFLIPQVRLWKAHSDAVTNADGTSTITVTLRVENTGTTTLTDLTLSEDLDAQFGDAFISASLPTIDAANAPTSTIPANLINSAWTGNTALDMFDSTVTNESLAIGEEFTVSFEVTVDPDLLDDDSDFLMNTADVTAVGPSYDPLLPDVTVSDQSGTDTGTGFDNDEPTALIVPEIAVAKAAGDAVANGDNFDVTFTLVVENTGSISLDMLTLFDDVTAQFDVALVDVFGLTIQNFAGSGTAPTANAVWESDTTQSLFNNDGSLNPGDGFEVVFTATIDPDGFDSMSQGLTNQATVGGRAVDDMGNPVTDILGNTLMASDDSDSGTSPQGTNTDENGDMGTSDDPTPIVIADISAAKQVVGTPTLLANGNFEATYQVVIENTGTVDLANLTLTEDLAAQFGAAYVDAYDLTVTIPTSTSSTVVLDAATWDGDGVGGSTEIVNTAVASLLTVGDSFTFEFKVEIDAAMATGVLENTVTAGGAAVDPSGNPYTDASGAPITATDDSDSGTDPSDDNALAPGDMGTTDDPTPLLIPNIGLAKEASAAVPNGDNFDVTFTLNWENTGTVALDGVEIIDNIMAQFGGQFVDASIDSVSTSGTASVVENAAWEGAAGDMTQSLIIHTGDDLAVGDTIQVVFTVTIDPDASGTSSGGLENQATSTGTGINPDTGAPDPTLTALDSSDNGTDPIGENGEDDMDGTFGNDPTPVIIPDISVAKQVVGTPALLSNGNFGVTYELVVENTGNVDLADLTLVEDLSAEFGSAFENAGSLTLISSGPGSTVVIDSNWDGDGSGTTEMINQAASTLLAVGESYTIQFTVEVDPDAVGAPATLDNQVTAGGAAVDDNGDPIDGIVVSDDSDSGADPNGTNPDGDGDTGTSDDPTPLLIPSIGLAKSAGDAVQNGDNFDITFTFVYENNGTVDLTNLSLTDDIEAEFGNAFVEVVAGSLVVTPGATVTPPGANAAWEGDTSLDLLDGSGVLAVGESVEVSFTVTIDPDGIDSVSQGLENQGVAAADGINPDTGAADPALATTDDSDNGTDPDLENGEDDGDGVFGNDPTPIVIADVSAAKQVVGTPTLLSNGDFEATYQVVIENTGTVDLANLTLAEDLATQFGGAYVNAYGLTLTTSPANADSAIALSSTFNGGTDTEIVNTAVASALAVGDSFVFEFRVEIDAAAATGVLDNTVTVGGDAVDENGDPILDSTGTAITATDDSDSGADPSSDNPDAPGDDPSGDNSDDPTPLLIPNIGLAKEAGDAVPNGDNFDVEFTLNWENTGTVALDGVEIIDNIMAQFGAQFVGATIDSVTTSGTAVVTANAGWAADMTQSLITHTGDDLAVGDTIQVVFTVTIDPDVSGTSTSGLENTATSTGTGVNPDTGAPDPTLLASDTSDNGTDPLAENGEDNGDGTFGNDPTPIIIPDVSVAKEVSGTPTPLANGNFEVTYSLVIENTGNVDLAGLTLVEDLAGQFGSAMISAGNISLATLPANANSNVILDSNWNGDGISEMIDQTATTLLAVGDSFVVEFTTEIDPDAVGAPGTLDNQVTVGGDAVDENGDPILGSDGVTPLGATDDSDSGSDPNGDNPNAPGDDPTGENSDDPTPLLIPDLGLAKSASDAVPNGDNFDVTFTFVIENNGTVDMTNLSLTDDIMAEFGNAFVSATAPTVSGFAGTGTAPGANAGWAGDSTQDLLDGTGQLNIGDSFEVSFTVTIDPDGIDSVSQGLQNQGTVAGDGINPDTGVADPALATTDDSDNGTDPDLENGEDDGDGVFGNDPTPIIIADVSAAKQVVGTPTLLSNGNFEAVYEVVIENTGTVDLANLTLAEDLATQFGGAYVNAYGLTLTTLPADADSAIALSSTFNGGTDSEIVNTALASALAVGDSFVFEFRVEIDAAAATGVLDNTVTVGGDAVDENGAPILDSTGTAITATDDSDSGADPSTDNPDAPGDGGTTDDPTPLLIPNLSLAKEAGDAVANGDNFDVEFTLVWENTGTVALDGVDLFDDIAAQFGSQFVGIVPSSLSVSSFAGTGSAPTANAAWEGDTTQSLITSTGPLQVGDTFEVTFSVTIDPDAGGTSSPGLENQATSNGTGIDPDTGLADPALAASDDSDNGADPLAENGEDNGDGVFGNDPTPIIIPDVSVAKEVSGTPTPLANGNFEVTYSLVIENTGNVDLAGLTLVEDLAAQFGSALVSAGSITLATPPAAATSIIALDGAWDGAATTEMIDQSSATLLAVGDSFVVEFTTEVDPDAVGAPGTLDNQVTVGGDAVDENGDPILGSDGVTPLGATDDSDSGSDPNGDNPNAPGDDPTGENSDDPTPLLIPDLGLAKSASDAVPNGDNFDVTFTFVIENNGTVDMTNLSLTDDIMAEFGNAFVSATAPTVSGFAGTGTAPGANAGWAGDSTQDLLDGTGQLNIGDSFEVSFTVTIDPDGIDSVAQGLENQGTVAGDGINPDTGVADPALAASDDSDNGTDPDLENGEDNGDGVFGNDPTPIIIADVSAAKQVVGTPALLSNGNFEATYQVVIENTGTVDLANLTMAEDLATQFGAAYVDAYGLTLITPPADANSSVTLDSANFDGGSATEIVNTAVPSALAVGDLFIFEFKVEIDAAAATGILDNTVTVGGDAVDENGAPILDSTGTAITATDDSDSGADPSSDNPDAPGDGGTTDDPTPLLIPNLSLAKEAGDAVANGDNFDVEFTLVWENTGTVALDGVELLDDIAAQFGSQFVGIVPSSLSVSSFAGTGSAPTANATWEGDTTQSLITSTGPLQVGDTFEVTFSVTIDPDAGGTSSPGLENQATSSGTGINPDTGLADPALAASDDSDNGTDPLAENGEDNGDGVFGNDPTPIFIPDVSVAKSVTGTPAPLANGNFAVTYSIVIENTGNVDLANLTLVEDLATEFGTVFVSAGSISVATPPAAATSTIALNSAWNGSSVTEMIDQSASSLLAVGDSVTVSFIAEVDPDAVGAPATLDNQVTVGGDAVDENGAPLNDASGNPIVVADDSDSGTNPNNTNPGDQGDTGGSDDPTPLLIPAISVGKVAGDARPDGDDWVVHFRLNVENTGTVSLENPTLFDDIAAQFGPAFVSVDNVAVVNFVGSGVAPGVNAAWTGDTSQDILDGTGSLDVGDRYQVVFRVTIDADAASQGLQNQATAGGDGVNPDGTPMTDSSGNPVSATDVSDNGADVQSENGEDNGDGVFGNDPTPIIIADIGLAKSVVSTPEINDQGNFVMTFQLVVENTGTVDLTNLSLVEDLSTQFGSAFVGASNVVITSPPSDPGSSAVVDTDGFNGSASPQLLDTTNNNSLVVGDSFTLTFDVEVNPMEVTGTLENQVDGTGDGVDANGNPILDSSGDPIFATDSSDSGTDPADDNSGVVDDRGTSDDPTLLTLPEVPTSEFLGSVFQDTNNNGIREAGEAGIEGVEVTLTGTDIYGNAVELTVLTDANGNYAFEDLLAGDYSVTAAQPDGFDDGIDSANAAFSTGNDEITNISLGFGESFSGNTFGERDPGTTSGNPARLPAIGPISAQRLSNRISGFLGGPGSIYSGVPIASNANPLTLDSGRPVTGGYATEFASPDVATDCGCPEVIETPCETVVPCEPCEAPVEEVVTECDPCGDVVQEAAVDCECQTCEEPVACDECQECSSCCDCSGAASGSRGGFLFRFKNWLNR